MKTHVYKEQGVGVVTGQCLPTVYTTHRETPEKSWGSWPAADTLC